MYRIGEFSKITKTTCRTLRHYEQEGILVPAYIDEKTGYRYYDRSQLAKMSRIVALKNIGLTLKEIKEILSGDKDIQDALFERKRKIEQEIVDSKVNLSKIEQIFNSTHNNFEVKLKELHSEMIFYRDAVLDDHSQLFSFIRETRAMFTRAETGVKCLEPKVCYICYTDDEYREEKIKVRYVQVVNQIGIETDEIKFMPSKFTTVASVYMQGSYSDQISKYEAVLQFATDNGYQLLGKNAEVYMLDSDQDNAIPCLSELQFPLCKKED